ncbi:MAG: hypothetical protein WC796_00910 [Candidatus Pacearchaeota archaeon]|jgi:uncharacterized Zn finger protein
MKKKYVKICPRCGSTNIKMDVGDASGTPYLIKCLNCGLDKFDKFPFKGLLEVEESKAKKLKEELKRKC